ncbi:Crp/Fnr family transcriptional regulator [Pedobacter miscanthi]|uniref:Crp/Fnr family transcriptional regulator n=1 Tax=Pedobacter miscanthi TaxID=2259170 RepID=A0A366L6E2_9SPHI|nr:Crp/Fnr family transcriptional regulator [Pedobacter miscanthi]RBQ09033.1 Crp/Fnr family transcriptional regulator [Pedobacter miscanthi]
MIEVFKTYLKEKGSFSDVELKQIESVTTIKKLRKRQYLLQEGDVWKYNAFITKGCVRTYTVDEKGNEHILNFAVENWWTGDRESLFSGKPSVYNIDALEDSQVALITKENFNLLCKEIPAFNNMVTLILEKSFIVSQSRIQSFISSSAEEKYLKFLETFPHLPMRVPQGMIASYLGITAETLSRIRKNALKK